MREPIEHHHTLNPPVYFVIYPMTFKAVFKKCTNLQKKR